MIERLIYNVKFLLTSLAGVDSDIIKKIPNTDRKPYQKIGILHLTMAILFIVYCYKAAEIISTISFIWLLFVCFVLFGIILYCKKVATRRLINRANSETKVSFLLTETVMTLVISLPFLNNKLVSDSVKFDQTYVSLENYRDSIKKEKSFINLDSLIYSLDSLNSPSKIQYLVRNEYIGNYLYDYQSFLKLATSKWQSLPLKDSSGIGDQTKTTLHKITAAISIYKDLVEMSDYSSSPSAERTALRFSDSLLSIPPSILNIAIYFKASNYLSKTFNDKFIILSYYIDNTTIVLFIAIFCLLIIFVFYIYSIINSYKDDFYHKLLFDKQKFNAEALNMEREKISEEFRLQSEIKSTGHVFQTLGLSGPIESVVDVYSDSQIEDESVLEIFEAAEKEEKIGNYERALYFVNKAIELDDEKFSSNNNYRLNPSLHELRGRLLNALKKPDEAKVALDRFVELNSEKKYQLNLTKEILLERLEIENLPFYGNFTWTFKPTINILLGKNGYGKSHLLGMIVALLYDDKIKVREWIPPALSADAKAKLYILSDHPINENKIKGLENEIQGLFAQRNTIQIKLDDLADKKPFDSANIKTDDRKQLRDQFNEISAKIALKSQEFDAEQRRILANKDGVSSNIGRVPVLAIPDTRFIDKSESTVNNSKSSSQDLKRDGGTEFLYSRSFSEIIKKGLFIVAQNNSTDFTKEPYNLIERVISSLADYGLQNQEVNVATSHFFKFVRIETVSTTGEYKFFVRSEESNEEFELQKISQGTFSILAICLMIYRFLSELKPTSKNVLLEKAIILIDEIDAHLHPSWERKIVGILSTEFPNVQFIITAHSPLVVSGCLEGEVSVLRHVKNGFALEQSKENFIGMTSSDIYKKVFEIEDRDQQYLKYSLYSDDQINELEQKKERLEKAKLTNESLVEDKELDQVLDELNKIDIAKGVLNQKAKTKYSDGEYRMLKREVSRLQKEVDALKK